MEMDYEGDVRYWDRYQNYCTEISAIERKLQNGPPDGKRERLKSRLNDVRNRLIPQLMQRQD